MTTEAETRVVQPQATAHQGLALAPGPERPGPASPEPREELDCRLGPRSGERVSMLSVQAQLAAVCHAAQGLRRPWAGTSRPRPAHASAPAGQATLRLAPASVGSWWPQPVPGPTLSWPSVAILTPEALPSQDTPRSSVGQQQEGQGSRGADPGQAPLGHDARCHRGHRH